MEKIKNWKMFLTLTREKTIEEKLNDLKQRMKSNPISRCSSVKYFSNNNKDNFIHKPNNLSQIKLTFNNNLSKKYTSLTNKNIYIKTSRKNINFKFTKKLINFETLLNDLEKVNIKNKLNKHKYCISSEKLKNERITNKEILNNDLLSTYNTFKHINLNIKSFINISPNNKRKNKKMNTIDINNYNFNKNSEESSEVSIDINKIDNSSILYKNYNDLKITLKNDSKKIALNDNNDNNIKFEKKKQSNKFSYISKEKNCFLLNNKHKKNYLSTIDINDRQEDFNRKFHLFNNNLNFNKNIYKYNKIKNNIISL